MIAGLGYASGVRLLFLLCLGCAAPPPPSAPAAKPTATPDPFADCAIRRRDQKTADVACPGQHMSLRLMGSAAGGMDLSRRSGSLAAIDALIRANLGAEPGAIADYSLTVAGARHAGRTYHRQRPDGLERGYVLVARGPGELSRFVVCFNGVGQPAKGIAGRCSAAISRVLAVPEVFLP